ncbi:MAG: 3-isopropylmalate dehydratase small subunit [Vicinamibacterales bacterium]
MSPGTGPLTEPFTVVCSQVAVIDRNDIDTDQIIPARFLTTTRRTGLAEHLFHDWRHDPDGRRTGSFVLDRPGMERCRILLAGENFGCGSSREHAAWALRDFGFRAIVAPSFGDIFRQNAVRNRLLPVQLPPRAHRQLLSILSVQPSAEVAIDLELQLVAAPGGWTSSFSIDPFARRCLLAGIDEIEYVLGHEPSIAAFERACAGSAIVAP